MKKILSFFILSFILFPIPFTACKKQNESELPHTPPATSSGEQVQVLPPRGSTDARTVTPDRETPPSPPISRFWEAIDVDVSHIDPNRKHVAFTFDDSPRSTLEKIVNVFASFNNENPDCVASATLFYNGVGISERSFPAMQTAYAVGLEAGNHTYSHFRLPELSESELKREIDSVDEILQKIDGKPRHLLRAPYGAINQTVRDVAEAPILDWSTDTLDWTGISTEEICESVLSNLESGGIVLMHDGFQNTVEAVKILLPKLKELGYQVTSVSQLSKIHDCPLRVGGVYTRARKQK